MPREMIEPHTDDKRCVRRGKKVKLTSRQVEVSRSLSADPRSKAKTIVKRRARMTAATGAPIETHQPTSLSRYSRWRLRTSR
jgi:hypothetical protein